jgi:hypothetical protein
MPKKSRDEVIREVAGYVDEAIRKNRRSEWLITALLIAQFVSGFGLLLAGAALDRWSLIAPGGAFTALLFWPIKRLIGLRANNLRLQLFPELLRLAETKESQKLAAKLVEKLIEKLEAE